MGCNLQAPMRARAQRARQDKIMPAPISRPTRARVRQLHEDGRRISDIARELGLARSTVSRYVAEMDAQHEVALSPAAQLTEDEVGRLRHLASLMVKHTCPACSQYIVTISLVHSGVCEHFCENWQRAA